MALSISWAVTRTCEGDVGSIRSDRGERALKKLVAFVKKYEKRCKAAKFIESAGARLGIFTSRAEAGRSSTTRGTSEGIGGGVGSVDVTKPLPAARKEKKGER